MRNNPIIKLLVLLTTLFLVGFLILVGIGAYLIDRKWKYEFPRPSYVATGGNIWVRLYHVILVGARCLSQSQREKIREERAIIDHYKNIKYITTYYSPKAGGWVRV